jgi:hypothetical protein
MSIFYDKWTAFWLSMLIPGAGQLAARSRWSLPWLLATGILASVPFYWGDFEGAVFYVAQGVLFCAMGLCSAEHAKRLCEPCSSQQPSGSAWRVRCALSGRAILARVEGVAPIPAARLWDLAADLPRFLTIDPFHTRVILMRSRPAVGVDLVLLHNAFGLRFPRFGRILRWRPGKEYAFSDLSGCGRGGFPHVFFVAVEPLASDPNASRLIITVRGKWASRWIPPLLGRWWVWYVSREHARLLRKALLT